LGAILAVVLLYWRRLLGLLEMGDRQGWKQSKGFSGITGLLKLFLACLPAFFFGALLHDYIKEHLFSSMTVALALLVGGVIMIVVERRKMQPQVNSIESITYRQSFLIGLFQCLALWPGMSRSASTIVGAMLLGIDRRTSAEFSFLVAVPVMFAAVGYDALKSYSLLSFSDLPVFVVGFLVSFASAVVAIKFFLRLLGSHTLIPFGVYRILLGILVILFVG
ncbi:MAG: undecaprenyl-diphosphate phosphatase, partial [Bdellovibrionales bacterium]|nr:undecaprenyl-diphosphate phosphatase [Bdellovibrionales bacterium]